MARTKYKKYVGAEVNEYIYNMIREIAEFEGKSVSKLLQDWILVIVSAYNYFKYRETIMPRIRGKGSPYYKKEDGKNE